jgi:hypothetical protein
LTAQWTRPRSVHECRTQLDNVAVSDELRYANVHVQKYMWE